MIYVGDSIALVLLLLIALVYFQNKYILTRASKYFSFCLIFTFVAATTRIALRSIMSAYTLPVIAVYLLESLLICLPVLTTALLSCFLLHKTIEHTNTQRDVRGAMRMINVTCIVYFVIVIANVWTGWLFTVGEFSQLVKGGAEYLIYLISAFQTCVVLAYCIKLRHSLSKNITRALLQCVPILAACTVLDLVFADASFFILALAMLELIFFLNFQNQRVGVNTLTKLNDRRRFYKEIDLRIASGVDFRTFFISLTNMNSINLTYGHKTGDEILYFFAFGLEKLFPHSVAFHMHGSTFALIVSPKDEEEANAQTEALLKYVRAGIVYHDVTIETKAIVSENRTCTDKSSNTFYDKLEYMEDRAEENHLDYILYTPELGQEMERRKYLISRLEHISRQDGYEIWFQPIYRVSDKRFGSLEVLLRLREPDGSMISPGEFIPIAEKTGRISEITWFVIEEACRTFSQTEELEGFNFSVNLPMTHLVDPELLPKLNEIVDRYGIHHSRISFEFTERVILEDIAEAGANMKHLVEAGYSFYLDDFGIGYSNFNCVLHLPLHTVKLDMSLTSTVERLRSNHGLVSILIKLFHDMGLSVVAEGAETYEQVELLKNYGVDSIQGFYYARPMPLVKLLPFVQHPPKQ